MVLVRRGGCAFVTKAEEVQSAGGAAVLVGSIHDYIVRMVGGINHAGRYSHAAQGVEPRWKGLNTAIPVAMVTRRAYSILVAESLTGSAVSFAESGAVSSAVWEALEKLFNGQGWPRSLTYAAKRHEELMEEHRAWPDRLATVAAAYKKLNQSDAAAPKRGKQEVEAASSADEL